MNITGDQSFLKNINRMALIRMIRSGPGLSRADLASNTGLTKSTVSQLVQELIDEGWLSEDEVVVTGSIGRRPTPLRLNTERLALIGADLNVGRIEMVATNLKGEVIGAVRRELATTDIKPVLEVLADGVAELVRQMHAQKRKVLGLGVAVPGPVHAASGRLHYSPNLGWRDVPLRGEIESALAEVGLHKLPVYLQRRAASAAVGEVEFAGAEVEEPLLYIHLGMAIGAGVFVSDRLLSGHGGFAGDVGHQQLVPDGPACSCGRVGCAEALVSMRAMSSALNVSPEKFIELAHAGDKAAKEAARSAGHYLGVLIHNLWATFDPAQVVLGGICTRVGDIYLESARATLDERAKIASLQAPKVSIARFGDRAVAIGATALVLHQAVRPI